MPDTWQALMDACMHCQECSLCQNRTNVVFGVGPHDARVMLIGEGPGQNEDLQGEPFVGRGGMLLDKDYKICGINYAAAVVEDSYEFVSGYAIPVESVKQFLLDSFYVE